MLLTRRLIDNCNLRGYDGRCKYSIFVGDINYIDDYDHIACCCMPAKEMVRSCLLKNTLKKEPMIMILILIVIM